MNKSIIGLCLLVGCSAMPASAHLPAENCGSYQEFIEGMRSTGESTERIFVGETFLLQRADREKRFIEVWLNTDTDRYSVIMVDRDTDFSCLVDLGEGASQDVFTLPQGDQT